MTKAPFISLFPRLWKLTTSVVRWGDMWCAWQRMESFREKLLQLAKKTKRFFFRSTAFYLTRDWVDVSSEFSLGSRVVLNTSADRFILSRTFFETNRFCFVTLKKTWIVGKEKSRSHFPTRACLPMTDTKNDAPKDLEPETSPIVSRVQGIVAEINRASPLGGLRPPSLFDFVWVYDERR